MPRRPSNNKASGSDISHNGRYRAVCDLTGFEGWNDEFVLDPYGKRVLAVFADKEHPLDKPIKILPSKPLPWTRPRPEVIDLDYPTIQDLYDSLK